WSTRDRDPQAWFLGCLHNHWAVLAIGVGAAADYARRGAARRPATV
ncbi:hypothetical protein ACV36R_32155, partial [Pseudomonas aeruginosa]